MPEQKLTGLNVVLFEARHAKTLADLVRLQGGTPVSAPAMKEVPLENNPAVFKFGQELMDGKYDGIILLTGVGTRYLIQILETKFTREEIVHALKETIVVPRGPKPIRVLNELGVPYAVTVPEPNTWKEILETLDKNKHAIPLAGKKIAVQEYGVTNDAFLEGLKARGAEVQRVPVYRWALPDDTAPLKNALRLIQDGKVQVLIFTTAVQIEHVMKLLRESGEAEHFKQALRRVVVASVGPDCSAALKSHGLSADLEPESPKMGPLVLLVAQKAKEILKSKS